MTDTGVGAAVPELAHQIGDEIERGGRQDFGVFGRQRFGDLDTGGIFHLLLLAERLVVR